MVTGTKLAYEIFLKHWDSSKIELQEHFKVMLLNRGNKVLGIFPMSMGGFSATIVDRKLIFATALKSNASKIILAHNHLDHLIITLDGYYSYADEGLIQCKKLIIYVNAILIGMALFF